MHNSHNKKLAGPAILNMIDFLGQTNLTMMARVKLTMERSTKHVYTAGAIALAPAQNGERLYRTRALISK